MTEREKCNYSKGKTPTRKEMMTKSVGELDDQLRIRRGAGDGSTKGSRVHGKIE